MPLAMETTPKIAKVKSVYGTPGDPESSPCEASVGKPRQQMSASLKARLKRSRHSFTSPLLSVAKRLNIEDDEEEDDVQHASSDNIQTAHADQTETRKADVNRVQPRPVESSESACSMAALDPRDGPAPPTGAPPVQRRDLLKREVKERTETLRRLKMVKMYRSKNDLCQLRRLIAKWRRCGQAALYELQADLPVDGRKASLAQLIHLFGLDDSILHFDPTEDNFTDA